MTTKALDIVGHRFGRLTVISQAPTEYVSGSTRTRWNCRCSCGGEIVAVGSHLRAGYVKSCGCIQNHRAKPISIPKFVTIERWNDAEEAARDLAAALGMA